ncbi:MAG: hypothetical protein JOZ78_21085 [Chroococcidiopsidaceae cyanobacterium CP_BM_ER_R8_30]|nr:hypothetical protein [Chroococcidiopsidaceae cyanobacterium CP_BM_ER_R8_30]
MSSDPKVCARNIERVLNEKKLTDLDACGITEVVFKKTKMRNAISSQPTESWLEEESEDEESLSSSDDNEVTRLSPFWTCSWDDASQSVICSFQ